VTAVAWLAVAVFTIAYVLIATEWIHRVAAALGGAVLMLLIGATDAGNAFFSEESDAEQVAKDVEWPTLVFFAGLFVMVGSLVNTGVIDNLANASAGAAEGRLLLTSMVLLWASGVLSAIVDNIPYVATMSPVVADLVRASGGMDSGQVLWWSLALGADLGGNATAVGASANVVILGIAERSGQPISFWQFTKYGLVVAAVTIAISMVYLWLCYFVVTSCSPADAVAECLRAIAPGSPYDAPRSREGISAW
jgi:Na+/H+ antiporter NhaD/arsenite permease-like protein